MLFQSVTAVSFILVIVQATPMLHKMQISNATAIPGNTTAATGNLTTTAVLPDGRIAQTALATDFNVLGSVFKSAVVKGDGLVFSDIVEFPTDIGSSIFDKAANTKPFTLSIDDKSIFTPKGAVPPSTIRRADLLPIIRSTLSNVATTGIKTMHFSLQQSISKPLNLTHDIKYVLAFLETADFATHQFDVRVGKVVDDAGSDGSQIVVRGNNKNTAGVQTLFSAPFVGVAGFQNFGLKMDFDANTMQVFHSVGDAPLVQVTDVLPNDMSGNGEYHSAVLKNPVGAEAQPAIVGAEGVSFWGDLHGGFCGWSYTLFRNSIVN